MSTLELWQLAMIILAYGLLCMFIGAAVTAYRFVDRQLPREPSPPAYDIDKETDPETLESMEII